MILLFLCAFVYFLNIIQRTSITVVIRKAIKAIMRLQKKKLTMLPVRPSLAFFHENILSLRESPEIAQCFVVLKQCLHISFTWPHLIHHLCFYSQDKIAYGGEMLFVSEEVRNTRLPTL